MHGLTGERTLMRIHIGERDKYHGRPLYEAIVQLLLDGHQEETAHLENRYAFHGRSSGLTVRDYQPKALQGHGKSIS